MKRIDHEHDLHHNIYEQEDTIEDVENDKKANGFCGTKTSPTLECEEGNGEGDDEHGDRDDSEEPHGQCCAVFVELEADEAIDKQTGAQCRGKPVLDRDKVRESPGARSDNAGVDDERDGSEGHVDVEKGRDLLPACRNQ